jgi:hypothetical protein
LLAALGDFVWHDLNADGIQNAAEPGIPDVVVNLRGGGANNILGDGDDIFASTTTDANGHYSFPNLQDGQAYQVTFDLPAEFDAFSPRHAGGDAAKDSEAAVSDIVTLPVTGRIIDDFTQGQQTLDLSFVVAPPTQACSSPITGSADAIIGGERELEFQVFQNPGSSARLRVSLTNGGRLSVGNGDSVISSSTVTWDGVDVAGAAPGLNIDLTRGSRDSAFVLDIPTIDLNASLTLRVEDNTGAISTLQKTTNARGELVFPYSQFSGNADFAEVKSITFVGTGPAALDFVIANIFTRQTTDLDVDAGMFQYVTIGDTVWEDLNADGRQDASEPGVAQVGVSLHDSATNALIAVATTDANGQYLFEDQLPGEYYVVFDLNTLPAGYAVTTENAPGVPEDENSDADPATGGTRTTGFLTSGREDLDLALGIVQAPVAMPQIDIQKSTNRQDADSPTGPLVPVGSEVTWVYTVTNLGNVPLGPVVVIDENGTPGDTADDFSPTWVGGDTDSDGVLDLNETWTYQATGTAQAGQYAAIATAIGTPVDSNNEPIPDASPVIDADPSHHFGYRAQLDIQKSTNGHDADSPTGPLVSVGSAVTWTYTVTNLGDLPLEPVFVLDDNGTPGDTADDFSPTLVGGDSDNDGFLDLNETWTYQATGTAQAGQYAAIATAIGTPVDSNNNPIPDASPVTDTDPSHHFGYRGQLDIQKSTNSQDADTPTGPLVPVGSELTWVYTVTNLGNVPLGPVVVLDDNGTPGDTTDDFSPTLVGGDTDNDGFLDLNETWTYQATGTVQAGQYAAIATAIGTPVDSNNGPIQDAIPVNDTDPSHHFGYRAQLDIQKSTNGQDADSPIGPSVPVGSELTWVYTVTNLGNVPLAPVVVLDDNGTPGDKTDDFSPAVIGGDTDNDGFLDLNEIWTYQATGIAQAGQYAAIATAIGTPVDSNNNPIPDASPVTDTDPSHHFGYRGQLDIQKSTNSQDADTPTGPLVPVGSELTWVYTVTNLGNVPLGPVVVLDDNGTPGDTTDDFSPTLVGGDTDNDGFLDLNETWTYQATGTVQAGQYAAIATAIGTPVDSNNGSIPDAIPVNDTDPSHHFGYRAQLDIQKATNGQDADSPAGPPVPIGSELTWVYTVTNLGNVPLGPVVVLDDNGTPGNTTDDFSPALVGGDTDNDGVLDLNETWTYQATGTVQAGQYAAIATAIGTPVDSNNGPIPDAIPVTDTDPSHHFGYRAQLDIQKSTNGQDADSPTGPSVPVGSELTWTYIVTNPSNVPVGPVVVLDDNGTPGDTTDDFSPALVGGDTDNDGFLDLNETWTYQATGTAQAGQYAATATAIGTPVDSNNNPIPDASPVIDTDPSHHFGYRAQLDIQKSTNGQDADSPIGPSVPVGSDVTWTYTVTNLGNVPLRPVVALDDNGTPGDTTDDFSPALVGGDTDNDGFLDLNETWTYQATGTAQAGQYAATATAIGTPVDSNNGPIPDANPVTDTDPSHHFGYRGQLDIQKATNSQDADTPTGPLVPVGSTVTWVYTVTNPGNVPLGPVVVLDDNGTPGDTTDDFSPALVDGDTDSDGVLDLNETWTYRATGTAQAGPYAAIATAIGTPVDSNNGPIPDANPVTDTDPSHHFGYQGQIDVEKWTNSVDADNPTGPRVAVGGAVSWTYLVTNPGNVPLASVAVFDDNGTPDFLDDDFSPVYVGGDTDGDGALDPDETWSYQAPAIAQAGQYGAVATATGTPVDPNNNPLPNPALIGGPGDPDINPLPAPAWVTDNDPSHHFGSTDSLIVISPDKTNASYPYIRVVNQDTGDLVERFLAYDASFRGGVRVATVDLTGDGVPEIITAPGRSHAPLIKVFTWQGQPLLQFLAFDPTFQGGIDVAAGDMDGDGLVDIAAGMSFGDSQVVVFRNTGTATAPAFSQYQAPFHPLGANFLGGVTVELADMGTFGTIDDRTTLDGKAEIVVGNAAGMLTSVRVFEYRGSTPRPVHSYQPFFDQSVFYRTFQGGVSLDVIPVGDDAIPDIVVGTGNGGGSRVQVLDGLNSSVIANFVAYPSDVTTSYNAPVRVAGVDTTGDGRADFIMTAQGPDGTSRRIRSFQPLTCGLVDEFFEQSDDFSGAYFLADL